MQLSLSKKLDDIFADAPDPVKVAFLKQQPFAHRGLHGPGRPENSRAAFQAAIDGGYGIELDVRLSRDGYVMVFHDRELGRLTQATGAVRDKTRDELSLIKLNGSDETIMTLEDALALIRGKVPVLIEVKIAEDELIFNICRGIRRALEGYLGRFAIMSFSPEVGRWFFRNSPKIVRGLVMTQQEGRTAGTTLRARFIRHALMWRGRPDFLAYDIRDLPTRFASSQRKRGFPLLTWTVRTPEQRRVAEKAADEIIFEQLNP